MNQPSSLHSLFHTPEKGLFISFEGAEGSGKSTQIQKLQKHFESLSLPCLLLREPGGTSFGEKLRAAILSQDSKLHPMAETFVFLASRAQLLEEKILPQLAQGGVVLLDRYIDSTLVYQALARQESIEKIWTLHQFAPLNVLPHRTFYLDISLEVSLERQMKRGQNKDYFESQSNEFQAQLLKGYRTLASLYPERIKTIQGTQSVEDVFRDILQELPKL